jgi:hypothetical protein
MGAVRPGLREKLNQSPPCRNGNWGSLVEASAPFGVARLYSTVPRAWPPYNNSCWGFRVLGGFDAYNPSGDDPCGPRVACLVKSGSGARTKAGKQLDDASLKDGPPGWPRPPESAKRRKPPRPPRARHNRAQLGLTSSDVTSLCRAASAEWRRHGEQTRSVVFTWRGKRYRSRLTNFRMLVDSLNEPVCCKWDGWR